MLNRGIVESERRVLIHYPFKKLIFAHGLVWRSVAFIHFNRLVIKTPFALSASLSYFANKNAFHVHVTLNGIRVFDSIYLENPP